MVTFIIQKPQPKKRKLKELSSEEKPKRIVRKKNPSKKLQKIYKKVDSYNKTAIRLGFPTIEYDYRTLLLEPFRSKENDVSEGFLDTIKSVFTYIYMSWKWDRVQSYKNKNL